MAFLGLFKKKEEIKTKRKKTVKRRRSHAKKDTPKRAIYDLSDKEEVITSNNKQVAIYSAQMVRIQEMLNGVFDDLKNDKNDLRHQRDQAFKQITELKDRASKLEEDRDSWRGRFYSVLTDKKHKTRLNLDIKSMAYDTSIQDPKSRILRYLEKVKEGQSISAISGFVRRSESQTNRLMRELTKEEVVYRKLYNKKYLYFINKERGDPGELHKEDFKSKYE